MSDHYAVLGIAPSASHVEVRRAYYKRAFAAHPDRGGSHAQMLAVNQAWAELGDPARRAAYDARLLRIARRAAAQTPAKKKPACPRPKASTRPPGDKTLLMRAGGLLGRTLRSLISLGDEKPKPRRAPGTPRPRKPR